MLSFRDQAPAYSYEVPSQPDSTFDIANNNDATLENFFRRPIRIRDYEWGIGTDINETFNPWADFFNNPRVVNRISNFNLLRCKLKLKVVINGNGFHFGRAILHYLPLHQRDVFSTNRGFLIPQDYIQASQRPHIYLDPTNSQGGELTLPFFWNKNALSIPLKQWEEMGNCYLNNIQDLRHANGATDQVTISIFAWAEDVQLSVPTSAEPGSLVPQMGKVENESGSQDEYEKDHLLSKTASAVADAAGMMKNTPLIGPYMRATEAVAKTTASVAKALGYCKPTNITDTSVYKPLPTSDLATTDGSDNAKKFTIDSKQELTIDPRVVGLSSQDELDILSIATRESWLTSFRWQLGEGVDQRLFEANVTPMTWAYVSRPGASEMHFPACAFAAAPFHAWQGTMKYRFQVVASNFHKGRLKIVYDPHGFQTDEFNTNYTHIVDIAEEKDFTVEIGWGTHEGFCIVGAPGKTYRGATISPNNVPFDDTSGSGPSAVPGELANGVIRVYVLNRLTVPSDDCPDEVRVNVFVSAGDDMQYRNPSDVISRYSFFTSDDQVVGGSEIEPQMGPINGTSMGKDTDGSGDVESTAEPSKPMQENVEASMVQGKSDDNYSKVYYGEAISSFRTLLKRYNHAFSVVALGGGLPTGTSWWDISSRSFPYYFGYAPGAYYSLSTLPGNSFNYGETTLLNYLTPAFTGRRGGIRWKAIFNNPSSFPSEVQLRVDRLEDNVKFDIAYRQYNINSENAFLRASQTTKTNGMTGVALTHTKVNPTLEWESPYQRNDRFLAAKEGDLTSFREDADGWQIETSINSSTSTANHFDLFCAGAEDFSLYFFTGCPVMYYNVTVPV